MTRVTFPDISDVIEVTRDVPGHFYDVIEVTNDVSAHFYDVIESQYGVSGYFSLTSWMYGTYVETLRLVNIKFEFL